MQRPRQPVRRVLVTVKSDASTFNRLSVCCAQIHLKATGQQQLPPPRHQLVVALTDRIDGSNDAEVVAALLGVWRASHVVEGLPGDWRISEVHCLSDSASGIGLARKIMQGASHHMPSRPVAVLEQLTDTPFGDAWYGTRLPPVGYSKVGRRAVSIADRISNLVLRAYRDGRAAAIPQIIMSRAIMHKAHALLVVDLGAAELGSVPACLFRRDRRPAQIPAARPSLDATRTGAPA